MTEPEKGKEEPERKIMLTESNKTMLRRLLKTQRGIWEKKNEARRQDYFKGGI